MDGDGDGYGGGGSVFCIYVPKDEIVYINVLEKDRITNTLDGEEKRVVGGKGRRSAQRKKRSTLSD